MEFRRREFLVGGGLVSTVGLAGCLGNSDDDESPDDTDDDAATDDTDDDEPANGVDDDGTENGDEPELEPGPTAVVSSHTLATEAGQVVLAEGGTAADAAVAVAAALSVVEPHFSSALGGGTWALYYDAETDELTSLDGVGPVGSEATVADYESRADEPGIHQAVVPGAWDGWMRWLDRYGELELGEVLSPAISYAREGYDISEEMAGIVFSLREQLPDRPAAGELYLRDGEPVGTGDPITQEEMADTFEALVDAYQGRRDEGRSQAIQAARDYFYRGPLAEAIVEFSDEHGGYLTMADFEGFEADIVEPISIDYDDSLGVYQSPPNSQGITMLLALNVLKGYDLSGYEPDDADAVHLQAEAIKLAFADRYRHVGDPDRVDVPVAELLAEEYADSQRDRIEMETAMEWPLESGLSRSLSVSPMDAHTTTFHVVDEAGNAAAVTTSLGAELLVIGETGIHINNRMRMISLEEDNPNRLTPGYKVRHTSNPFVSFRDGELHSLGGTIGVDTQPQGQVQQFLNVVEFGLDAEAAVSRPRFVSTAFPAGTYPYDVRNTLQMEADFPSETVEELESRGHDVEVGTGLFGISNMVVFEDDTLTVGADPRMSTAAGVVESPVQNEDHS